MTASIRRTLYAHLPGVRLDNADAPLAGGRITRLPFDDWARLESEFEFAQREYDNSQPTFWVWDRLTDDAEDSDRWVVKELTELHTAFLLDHRVPLLPSPLLSSCYIQHIPPPEYADTINFAVKRLIGPAERELVVYGDPLTYSYSAEHLAAVARRLQFLRDNKTWEFNDEISAAIRVLEETTRPDSWYGGDLVVTQVHGFVRCMAACEGLLLPDEVKTDITQTFGRRAATVINTSPERKQQYEQYFIELYRLRSHLIHGNASKIRSDPQFEEKLASGRVLLRYLIMSAIYVRNRLPAPSPLWQLLHDCTRDHNLENRLRTILADRPNL